MLPSIKMYGFDSQQNLTFCGNLSRDPINISLAGLCLLSTTQKDSCLLTLRA